MKRARAAQTISGEEWTLQPLVMSASIHLRLADALAPRGEVGIPH